jgi:hypothetical protein
VYLALVSIDRPAIKHAAKRERERIESLEGAVIKEFAGNCSQKNDVKCCWGIHYYGF